MTIHPGNAEGWRMDLVTPCPDSPLKGKKVLFLGSSVTLGYGSLREAIPEYFAARFGCQAVKEAVSGTTLTDDRPSSYVNRLLTRVDPAERFDLVIVQLSTNDAAKKKPLGEIPPSLDRTRLDTHTVSGAIGS